ncbi:alpha/beta fold hydrolase [Flammeovirga sp. MY04]|uniref:alpha/beta hydrolase family protein n=1 Tax=Flammeovirga sp. MY04 TaxID=1191459 RepID=UPI000806410A|nr:alpha/beta fold hydrolase [Flammeovirga sp. MY04]ANQ51327.1 alpha/beta fold hydrolase [Flammeovirga sp. MY04]
MKIKLLLLTLLFSSISMIHAQNLAGPWKGTLNLPNGKLDIIFKISTKNNELKGIMDIPAQGVKGLPIHEIKYHHPIIQINLPNLGIEYVGSVMDDDNIEGHFKQGGQKFSMNLVKNLSEETPLAKPQEPKPPFKYVVKDIEFYNQEDGIMLSGTFTRPTDLKRYPTVILIAGSGPSDRDQTILGHKPFLLLADVLTKKGFAVLRFDERGVGQSQGDFSKATTYDFKKDVEAAISFLKKRTEVDPSKIGLIGHSEGGIIAQMIASESSDIAYTVLMASPTILGRDLLLHQKRQIEILSGVPDKAVAANQEIFENAYNIIINNEQPLDTRLREYFKHQYQNNISNQQLNSIVQGMTNKWFIEFVKLDPKKYLEKIKTPLYALNGSNDVQVIADENLQVVNDVLTNNENPNFKTEKLEGLNHLFQESTSGLPAEYGLLDQTLSPVFLEKVSSWLVEVVKVKE